MRRVATVLVGLLWASSARAGDYAVVVGYNSPPIESEELLTPLRFADDDAARFYEFFERMGARVALLSVFDDRTQRRYPEATARTIEPTLENLRRTMRSFREAMAADRSRGESVRFFFTYSGHGARSSGGAFLTLSGGGLTEELLFDELFKDLPANTSHLIVDACNAGGVLGVRGQFDRELNASPLPIESDEIVRSSRLEQIPSFGAILASAEGNESHEWSEVEAGVFTHEVLSALSGAADINRDRIIEYSEVQAFIASANRDLSDPRAIAQVVARPPRINRRAPLVELDDVERVSFLRGSPGRLGRFFIELENGQRYLDAHLASDVEATLIIPADHRAYLRADRGEAVLQLAPGSSTTFAQLSFHEQQARDRGSIEHSFHDRLFASPYNTDYYRGFVDRSGAPSVDFPNLLATTEVSSEAPVLSLSLLGAAGALLITSGVATGVALDARSGFGSTELQKPAHDLAERHEVATVLALGSVAAALVSGLLAYLFWPEAGRGDRAEYY